MCIRSIYEGLQIQIHRDINTYDRTKKDRAPERTPREKFQTVIRAHATGSKERTRRVPVSKMGWFRTIEIGRERERERADEQGPVVARIWIRQKQNGR